MDSSFYYEPIYELAWYVIPFVLVLLTLRSSRFKELIGAQNRGRLSKLKIPFVVVGILVCTFVYYQDDELLPEVVSILALFSKDISLDDNGSVYHMGMWSNLNSSPYEVGLWRINQYKGVYRSESLPSTTLEYEDYPEEDWIEDIFEGDNKPKWICDFDEYECLEMIFNQSQDAVYLVAKFEKYLERYDGVLKYTYFGLFLEPSSYAPLMKFGPGIDVLKIKLISQFHDFRHGSREAVINQIIVLVEHHKRVLAQSPYTVSKVISVVELLTLYKAAAYLISKTNQDELYLWQPYIDSLSPLTKDQLTFDKPLLFEFVSSYNSFKIAGLGNFRENLPSILRHLPKSFLYKANKTANQIYTGITVNRGKYEFVGDRIVVHDKPDVKEVMKFDLTNPIGSLLAVATVPRFIELDGQMHNLEILQRMTKYLFFRRKEFRSDSFISPYTGETGQLIGNQYCIDSEKQEDELLCLSSVKKI